MSSIQQWASSDSAPWTKVNETAEAAAGAWCFAQRQRAHSALVVGYGGGTYEANTVADGTVTCTDNATNYIVVNRSTRAVSTSTSSTNWNDTTTYGRMARAVFASGVLTYHDERFGSGGIFDHSGGASITALTGDVTASGPGSAAATIANDAVTYAKLQNVSATSRVLGRKTSGSGDAEECTLSEILDFIGSAAQGDILFRGASAWARLAAGTSGYYLQTQGAGANPLWAAGGGGGGSTQGKHAISVQASSMLPALTSGCAPLNSRNTGSGKADISYLSFDPSSVEYAHFMVAMPKKWNESTVTFRVRVNQSSTSSGGVAFSLQGVAVSDGDSIPTAFGTAVTVTKTVGTADTSYVSSESSAITIAGSPAAEDMVFFRLAREVGNGSDTLAIDADLLELTLYITTDADTDA